MSFTIRDTYNIRPSKTLLELDDSQKKAVMDSAMVLDDETNTKKGLIVEFDLSSSLRRTNNRLYTPRGQRQNVDSWTTPFAKPILVHHEKKADPIGRIVEVNWVPNDDQAMAFFPNIQDFMKFKRVCDQDNPQKIYKEMLKHNLLTNDAWPGLGRLVAKARISDPEAIQKFLDGRYLTFSAGSNTDRYACGICGSDWVTGDFCDHSPGSISDEGKPAVFITGSFKGVEASVVTDPANPLAQVKSMEFGDSVEVPDEIKLAPMNTDALHFIDAHVDTGDIMDKTHITTSVVDSLMTMDARDIARGLWDQTLSTELVDALAGKSHYEVSWLVRIHDALHSEYDWRLRWAEEDSVEVPDAVFAFHGDIHELSTNKGFRDSLANGVLDGFGKTGDPSEEYMSKRSKANSDQTEESTFAEQFKLALGSEDFATAVKAALEVKNGTQVEDEGSEVIDLTDLDWFVLDLALKAEIGDGALADEALAELAEDKFLGDERRFPVADAAHLEAARRILENVKLTEDQKDRFSRALEGCEKALEPAPVVENNDAAEIQIKLNDLTEKHEKVLQDYQNSMELATQLQAEVDSLKEELAKLDNKPATNDNTATPKVDEIKPVADPSASSAQALDDGSNKLSAYQQKVVSQYKSIRDERGEAAANQYLIGKYRRRILPKSFDIKSYLQESE